MRYVYDHDLHIHSKISLCSNDPNQTSKRILKYAVDNGLKTVCLTDHFWDENVSGAENFEFYAKQNFEHINAANPLPQTDGVKFLFGCETEMDRNMTVGISRDSFDKFDFVIIPTTHFHMTGFTIPEDCTSPEQRAELWVQKLDALLDMDLPFYKIGIAHLTCSLIMPDKEGLLKAVDAIDEREMTRVFANASKKGVGIELNSFDMRFSDAESNCLLRPYRIAKQCGCKFYMGSDAHHPGELDGAREPFERAIDFLGLEESDKFLIK